MSIKRCGIETKVVIEHDSYKAGKPQSDSLRAIQEAVKYGLAWNELLITGKVINAKEIAHQENVSDTYVCQCVKFAFLSPENIKRIVEGNIPFDMTIKQLKQGFPLDWKEQEKLFAN